MRMNLRTKNFTVPRRRIQSQNVLPEIKSHEKDDPMDEPRVITCDNTACELVNNEKGDRCQTTHITAEVEPKRKTSAIKGTLESPRILH
jgi:hypothetical protein